MSTPCPVVQNICVKNMDLDMDFYVLPRAVLFRECGVISATFTTPRARTKE